MKKENEREEEEKEITPAEWEKRVAGTTPIEFNNRVTQIRHDCSQFFSEVLRELNNCRVCLENYKCSFAETVDSPDYQLLINWRYRFMEIRDEICREREEREAIEEARETDLAELGECPTDETAAREWYMRRFRIEGMNESDITDRYDCRDEDLCNPTEFLYRTPRKRDDNAIPTEIDSLFVWIRSNWCRLGKPHGYPWG